MSSADIKTESGGGGGGVGDMEAQSSVGADGDRASVEDKKALYAAGYRTKWSLFIDDIRACIDLTRLHVTTANAT